jgi:DNA-binding protein HU-beta
MTIKPLTKAELVAAVANVMGSDKKTAASALEALAAVVARTAAVGGALTLPGIGKLVSRDRPARTVRNPRTGEEVQKPAERQVKFAIAKSLKTSANG